MITQLQKNKCKATPGNVPEQQHCAVEGETASDQGGVSIRVQQSMQLAHLTLRFLVKDRPEH